MTDSRVNDSTPHDVQLDTQRGMQTDLQGASSQIHDSTVQSDQIAPIELQSPTQLPLTPLIATIPSVSVDISSTSRALTISQLAASIARVPKIDHLSGLNSKTPAVLSSSSTDQGVVYEWDFWRPHAQYLSDTLAKPDENIEIYRRSLLESCGLVANILAHYDLLRVSEATLYAFSAEVDDEVQYRYQPIQHPMRDQPVHQQQNLYYPTYEITGFRDLEALLQTYFADQVLPTELEFAGVGHIVGVGEFQNPFSFSYEVFESFERIRLQTRSTAWLTCDLQGMPQMALYTANGWRLEQALTDLVFFLGQQGFQLEQNQREKIAFSQQFIDMNSNATRYADWDGDYLVNRSTLEPAGDQLLDVVSLFNLNVEYASPF